MELVMLAAVAKWDNDVGAGQVARGRGREGSLSRWFTKRSSSLHQKSCEGALGWTGYLSAMPGACAPVILQLE
jgi:hypothetical protein